MVLVGVMMITNTCWDWHANDDSTEEEEESLFYVLTLEASLTSNYWVYSDFQSKKKLHMAFTGI